MSSDGTSSAQKRTSSALPTTIPTVNGGDSRASAAASALPRGKQIHRSCNNMKITILCGFVTILVLRGTIGLNNLVSYETQAGNQRLIDETNRIIAEIRSGNDPGDQPDEFLGTSTTAFVLGPKISTWDRDRRLWLRRNPHFPSYINGGPRILLVTSSAPNPCDNPVGDHYLLKFLKNKVDYCRIHGIEIVYNMANLDKEMTGYWAKLPLIRRLMLSHPEVEWVWWIDSDALFTDMAFEIPFSKYKDHNMIIHGHPDLLLEQHSRVAVNTGSFLLRNCQWSLDLLDAWAPTEPNRPARDEASRILTANPNGHRLDFEADDQTSLIHLLISQNDKWARKVFVESSYLLHGIWEDLVNRYEEMFQKYHPGLGDERWPLVTHFAGCGPCGSRGTHPPDKCLRSMERAFNFADNQVLSLYGFRHRGLVSPNVKRTRNETSTPLMGVKSVRHSSFVATS